MTAFASNPITIDEIVWCWVKPLGYLWFLYAVMLMEIIQDIFDGKVKSSVHVAIAVGLFLMNRFIGQGLSSIAFSETVFSKIFGYYIYFVIGKYYGYKIVEVLSTIKYKWQVSIGLLILVVFGKEVVMAFSLNNFPAVKFILAGAGIVSIILLGMTLENNKLFNTLGNACFPIYLLHEYVIVVARITLSSLINEAFSIPLLVVGTVVGLSLPQVILWGSKKIFYLDFVFFPSKYLKIK